MDPEGFGVETVDLEDMSTGPRGSAISLYISRSLGVSSGEFSSMTLIQGLSDMLSPSSVYLNTWRRLRAAKPEKLKIG